MFILIYVCAYKILPLSSLNMLLYNTYMSDIIYKKTCHIKIKTVLKARSIVQSLSYMFFSIIILQLISPAMFFTIFSLIFYFQYSICKFFSKMQKYIAYTYMQFTIYDFFYKAWVY